MTEKVTVRSGSSISVALLAAKKATKRALIIVDVQNDFIDGGALPVGDGLQAAHRIATILPLDGYDQIVTTQDWHVDPGDHFSATPDFENTWPVHCVAGTEGAELSPRLDPILDRIDARFFKGHHSAAYSGFEGVSSRDKTMPEVNGVILGKWLNHHGITEVDIVGIATDYCVKATALDAVKHGLKTRVLVLFCAEVDGHEGGSLSKAIEEMEAAGVEVARHAVA